MSSTWPEQPLRPIGRHIPSTRSCRFNCKHIFTLSLRCAPRSGLPLRSHREDLSIGGHPQPRSPSPVLTKATVANVPAWQLFACWRTLRSIHTNRDRGGAYSESCLVSNVSHWTLRASAMCRHASSSWSLRQAEERVPWTIRVTPTWRRRRKQAAHGVPVM